MKVDSILSGLGHTRGFFTCFRCHFSLICSLIALNSTIECAIAEDVDIDNDATWSNNARYNNNINSDEIQDINDWYIFFIVSLLFVFCVTFFVSMIGYFSLKEDTLVQKYYDSGQIVHCNIMSAQLVRNFQMWPGSSNENNEYLVTVEYSQEISEYSTVRIRKQLKVRKSDFRKREKRTIRSLDIEFTTGIVEKDLQSAMVPAKYNASLDVKKDIANNYETNLCFPCPGSFDDDETSGPIIGLGPQQLISDHSASSDFIETLVVPGFPLSAYPRNTILRNCGIRYRLLTFGWVLFDFIIVLSCIFFAIHSVQSLEDEKGRKIGRYGIGLFVLLFILEVPIIHIIFNPMLEQMLKDEYLTSGEVITPFHCDDSTISSASDIFLKVSTYMSRGLTSFETVN